MADDRPYSWLGVAIEPDFYFTDCGHLIGCSDPTYDLEAKQRELREADFMRCLKVALQGGGRAGEDGDTWAAHGRRSSCQQSESVCEALDALAIDPSEENRMRAIQARWDYEEWLADDAD